MHSETSRAAYEFPSYLYLRQVAQILPSRCHGKRLSYATIWRWALKGRRGRVLRTVSLPGGLATRIDWINEFIGVSTETTTAAPDRPSESRTRRQAELDRKAAEAVLRSVGIKPKPAEAGHV